MQFTLFEKNVRVDDAVASAYDSHIHELTQDEIEYLGASCRFTEDTPAKQMGKELTEAMEEMLDLQSAMPTIIRKAKEHGMFQ
jgi:hypothetical protein